MLFFPCFCCFAHPSGPRLLLPKAATVGVSPEPPKDPLGRDTPRKTVLRFLIAAREGNAEIAALYLDTSLRGEASANLARQLAIVLNRRLPARLNDISDNPEGSLSDPLNPDEDLIGTISTSKGDFDIVVEHVNRGANGKIWLFSEKTLASIPSVFEDVNAPGVDEFLPKILVTTRLANIPIFEWLALFVGMPLLYLLTGVLGRIIGWVVGVFRRRLGRSRDLRTHEILRPPVRLLFLALAIRQLSSKVSLPLLARQFWSTTALTIAGVAGIWLLMLLNSWGERYLVARVRGLSGSAAVLRLVRRLVDVLVLVAGLLLVLHYFDVNVTAALAGLGIGGIAIALAAQKTLENVIAGVSLIADQVVRIGDLVKVDDIQGTVEEVGLRSTRIRTLDRTLVCLPNGLIANMRLETLSARDKYWFHPLVGLRCGTTPAQMCSVITDIHNMLSKQINVDSDSIRVRFIRFGVYSLDVDIFAYVFAGEINEFLKIQEVLLMEIMTIVHKAGTEIALPLQAVYIAADPSDKSIQTMQSMLTPRS